MGGGTQCNCQHGIARRTDAIGERINLAFSLTGALSSRQLDILIYQIR